MKLIEFIVRRKILVALMTILIVMLGCFSMLKLDKELLPSIKMDGAYVEISAGEMAAIEVERTITTPLEEKLKGIEGVEDFESTSTIGRSSLLITFERGNGDDLYKEVESIANSLKGEVPEITDVISGQKDCRSSPILLNSCVLFWIMQETVTNSSNFTIPLVERNA